MSQSYIVTGRPRLQEAICRPAIAELGKEPHNRLSGVVSPNNHAMPRAHMGVLGNHALPGFDIAKKEILLAASASHTALAKQKIVARPQRRLGRGASSA